MTRTVAKKLTIAALGGFLVASVVLGAMLFSGVEGLGGSTVLAGTGWMLPLLAGALTGICSWALVRGPSSGSVSARRRITAVCPACGGTVGAEWRLCPHCGDRITAI